MAGQGLQAKEDLAVDINERGHIWICISPMSNISYYSPEKTVAKRR